MTARGNIAEIGCVLALNAVPVAGYGALYGNGRHLVPLLTALFTGLVGQSLTLIVAGKIRKYRSWPSGILVVPAVAAWAGLATMSWLITRPDGFTGDPLSELVHGPGAVLTLNQPVDVTNDVLALPFALTFTAAAVSLLALRSRSLLTPVLPAVVALALQLLLCAGYGGPAGIATGVGIFAVAAVVLVGIRRGHALGVATAGTWRDRLWIVGTATFTGLVVGVTAAVVVTPGRLDPRDRWRPVETEERVTPLAFVRSELSGPDAGRFTLRVSAPVATRYVVLARLDVFDGAAWTAHPRFRIAGTVLRPDDRRGGTRTDFDVLTVPGSLLPQTADPVRLTWRHEKSGRGTVLVDRTSGMLLAQGDPASRRYSLMDSRTGADPSAPEAGTGLCSAHADDTAIRDLRQQWLSQRMPDRHTLEVLAARMRSRLPYNPGAPAGSSLAAISRVLSGTGRANVGYAEQHAAAFSFLACAAGRPSRVVVGYLAPGKLRPGRTTLVTAHDAHAWSEVFFPGTGWVTFDPTDRFRPVTALDDSGPENTGGGSASSSADAAGTASTGSSSGTSGSSGGSAGFRRTLSVLKQVARPLSLFLLALVLATALVTLIRYQRRRRHRRRESALRDQALRDRRVSPDSRERVLAAWGMVVQRCAERGTPVSPAATPEETAVVAAQVIDDHATRLPELVGLTNAALFSPYSPTAGQADLAGVLADELLTATERRPVSATAEGDQ